MFHGGSRIVYRLSGTGTVGRDLARLHRALRAAGRRSRRGRAEDARRPHRAVALAGGDRGADGAEGAERGDLRSCFPHGSGRCGEMMADLQAFGQAFPKLACFRPRISKQIFGGFVRFQGVTRVPNLKSLLPNFFAAPASFWTHFPAPPGRFPPTRAARGRTRSAEDRERFRREWRRASSSAASIRVERSFNLARILIIGRKMRVEMN